MIRFAQRLGYAGYPQLIEDVQHIVQAELGTTEVSLPVGSNRLTETLANEMENLRRVIGHVSGEAAEKAMGMIREARNILVLGQGAGGPLAQLFCLGLRAIGFEASSPAADPLSLAMVLRDVGEGHLVISVSVALETEELANALRFARERGAKTMALTWSHVSRCAQAADLVVSCLPDDKFPLRSITPLALIIDSLLQTLALADEAARERVAEFGRIRDQLVSDLE
ncbi:MAG: MurR/RpiR family transcriptional regulator [Thermoleophilia bacterium]|nr:MurR/RpiR family transcriptional regulator [Thermoleophilia bacterium]